MIPNHEENLKEIKDYIEKFYLSRITNQIALELQLLSKVYQHIKEFKSAHADFPPSYEELLNYKKQLHSLLLKNWELDNYTSFSESYPGFSEALSDLFERQETHITRKQGKTRFYPSPQDSFWLKLKKLFKRTAYLISQVPGKVANIFSAPKDEALFWRRTFPYRNLVKRHFGGNLMDNTTEITSSFFKLLSGEYKELMQWEGKSHIELTSVLSTTSKIEEFVAKTQLQFGEMTQKIIHSTEEGFKTEFELAGTMELPSSLLSDQKTTQYVSSKDQKWVQNNNQWRNTLYALVEKWRCDIDLQILQQNVRIGLAVFQDAQIKRLIALIDPDVSAIQGFIDKSSNTLDPDNEQLATELKKMAYQSNKTLGKELVPSLVEKLSGRGISGLVTNLEVQIKGHLDKVSHKHIFTKQSGFDQPLKKEELIEISLAELIRFESLPTFQTALDSVKKELFSSLEAMNIQVSDIDQIVGFSLQSAIEAIEEEVQSERATLIAQEGMQRASAKLAESRKVLENTLNAGHAKILSAGEVFCQDLSNLVESENMLELKVRLSKAKAAKQAEDLRRELQESVISRKEEASSFISKITAKANGFLDKIRNRIFESTGSVPISRDVSEFLSDSQRITEKLPVLYRRLYRIQPLEEIDLFVGRKLELGAFKEAFDNWQKGQYVTTAITGEKWGGMTSFLNFAFKSESLPCSVKRISFKQSFSEPENLIESLCELVSFGEERKVESLIKHLNEGMRRIIVMEDLQKFYIRKPGGFKALKLFREIVSNTHSKVFWVVTCTNYTWSYLRKAIKIHEFFSHEITMKDLTKDEIYDIIVRRNRISGFDIKFYDDEPEGKEEEKLTRQEELRVEFFTALNNFAKSNVSLALMYWLLSTKEIGSHQIIIGKFKNPHINFLGNLTLDKVFVLMAIVLHDGLSTNQLASVLNVSEEKCREAVQVLRKDGIITYQDFIYNINPLVFRSTVGLLKSKNLIH